MAIIRWDPFREMSAIENWNPLFGDAWSRWSEDNVLTRGTWIPPVDIYETDGHGLVVEAELPGMKREDIQVTVENGTLTIKGERKVSEERRKEQVHRVERTYGSFSRTFSLPQTVDSEHVMAEYRDGTLRVTLPLREEAKPRRVQVTVAA